MTDAVLLQLTLRREQDIFAVRQHGREAAAALGLEHQDQIRIPACSSASSARRYTDSRAVVSSETGSLTDRSRETRFTPSL